MNKKIPVPYTFNRLFTDGSDIFKVGDDNEHVLYEDYTYELGVLWNLDQSKITKSLVIAITTLGINIPTKHFDKIFVGFKDDNPNNCHFLNLWYKFIRPIEHEKYKGLYYIPYFTNYLVNRKGDVYSLLKQNYVIQQTQSEKHYYKVYNVVKDCHLKLNGEFILNKQYRLARYRALALVFLDYCENPWSIEINHIDGVKDNDNLDNLEWCDRQRNASHAYETGLRTDNVHVIMKDYLTGDITEHYSIEEAGRYIGVDGESVRIRLINDDQRAIKGRYSVQYKDKLKEWQYSTLEEACNGVRKIIVYKNIFTGEIKEEVGTDNVCKSITDVDVNIGMISFILHEQNKRGKLLRPYKGYLFKFKHDQFSFPELTDAELVFYRKILDNNKRNMECTPIVIIKNGKFVDVATNFSEAMEISGVGSVTIRHLLRGVYRDNTTPLPNGDVVSSIYLYKDDTSMDLNYCPVKNILLI